MNAYYENKVAVVTGAASGIGLALSELILSPLQFCLVDPTEAQRSPVPCDDLFHLMLKVIAIVDTAQEPPSKGIKASCRNIDN